MTSSSDGAVRLFLDTRTGAWMAEADAVGSPHSISGKTYVALEAAQHAALMRVVSAAGLVLQALNGAELGTFVGVLREDMDKYLAHLRGGRG